MIFKEAVALLLDGRGGYTCSSDLQAEKRLYEVMLSGVQEGIDRAKEVRPDITDSELSKYLGNSLGQTMMKTKDCLESYGYDTSTLPQVIVPEFGDISSLILKIGIGGTIIVGAYAANHLRNKGFGYKI